MVFDKVFYVIGDHAADRCVKRVGHIKNKVEAKEYLRSKVRHGKVLLDVGDHRYIRNGLLFFPCIKSKTNTYKVKSTLIWDMVKNRMQAVIDKYK